MRITVSVTIDPARLRPHNDLSEIHLSIAEAFAKILNSEPVIEIQSFDLYVESDPNETAAPPGVNRWLKHFVNPGRDEQTKK